MVEHFNNQWREIPHWKRLLKKKKTKERQKEKRKERKTFVKVTYNLTMESRLKTTPFLPLPQALRREKQERQRLETNEAQTTMKRRKTSPSSFTRPFLQHTKRDVWVRGTESKNAFFFSASGTSCMVSSVCHRVRSPALDTGCMFLLQVLIALLC